MQSIEDLARGNWSNARALLGMDGMGSPAFTFALFWLLSMPQGSFAAYRTTSNRSL